MSIWHTAKIEELPVLQKCAMNNGFLANNYSAVNTILYSKKYKALISFSDEWFFEKYCDDDDNTAAFSFPHNINGNKDNLKAALDELIHTETGKSGKNNITKPVTCIFKNITAPEKDFLSTHFEIQKIELTPAYSDYIYLTENLSSLPGATYSKKRNHINQFKKKHPDFSFELLDSHNISIVNNIEEKWFLENTGSSNIDIDLHQEREIITNALNNFEAFSAQAQMRGGILFVNIQPVAFCLSSLLSPLVTDIHFEKCLADFAKDGGYAVINNEYAKTISTKYINREEDLGIEGLRKAKRSYYPEIILEKFDVEIKCL
ncbi:MAG: DUF2156 domain-containing protein [Treponema sp.]|nr:DUF2156 domain-containing protein [Treponema sp.]